MSERLVSLLVILLTLTAATGQTFLYVREGGQVTLPCGNETVPPSCNSSSWFRDEEVVPIQDDASRLSVTPDCSLVIKRVKTVDVGHYYCDPHFPDWESSHVLLSVVTMTSIRVLHGVRLTCQVSTKWRCPQKVQWLLQGWQVPESGPTVKPSTSCSSFVQIPYSAHLNSKRFTCGVVDDNRVLWFDFRPAVAWATVTYVAEASSTVTSSPGRFVPAAPKHSSAGDYLMMAFRVVVVFLIAVVPILLIGALRNQRTRGSSSRRRHGGDDDGDDDDDDDVKYENTPV